MRLVHTIDDPALTFWPARWLAYGGYADFDGEVWCFPAALMVSQVMTSEIR